MRRKPKAISTGNDFNYHADRPRRAPRREQTDAQLLRQAEREAKLWQQKLVKDRRAELNQRST